MPSRSLAIEDALRLEKTAQNESEEELELSHGMAGHGMRRQGTDTETDRSDMYEPLDGIVY